MMQLLSWLWKALGAVILFQAGMYFFILFAAPSLSGVFDRGLIFTLLTAFALFLCVRWLRTFVRWLRSGPPRPAALPRKQPRRPVPPPVAQQGQGILRAVPSGLSPVLAEFLKEEAGKEN